MKSRAHLLPLAGFLALLVLLGAGLFAVASREARLQGRDDASANATVKILTTAEPAWPLPLRALGARIDAEAWDGQGGEQGGEQGGGQARAVLVNFFASWCAPCIAEHDTLLELEGIDQFGIVWNDRADAVARWLERDGNPFSHLGQDDGALGRALGVSGVPTRFLVMRGTPPRLCARDTEPLVPGSAALARLEAELARCTNAAPAALADGVAEIVPAPVFSERPLADLRLEAEAARLFRDLRCLVCEAESLASSRAPFALELRAAVRARLKAGEGELEVRTWLLESYGTRIFLTPPPSLGTLVLWAVPPLAFFVVVAVLLLALRRTPPRVGRDDAARDAR